MIKFKEAIKKAFCAVLAAAMLPVCFSQSVSAEADEFSCIEFYTLEMRSSGDITKEEYLSGYASAANPFVYQDFLVVPAYFSNPKTEENRNKIFVYSLKTQVPTLVKEYNMTDMGISARTGQYASQDIISGIFINDDYMFVSVNVNTSWPENKSFVDTLYIYENPLKNNVTSDTLCRVKANDQTVYSGTISDIITDGVKGSLYNDGAVKMNALGNYLITFNQEHNITANSIFSVSDFSGEAVAVSSFSESAILTYEGKSAKRFFDVAFEGNYAYVLAALDEESSSSAVNLAIFSIDFSNPQSPSLADFCEFESAAKYSELSNLGAYITIESGFAYVSTCGINNRGTSVQLDGVCHLMTLSHSGTGFSFIKDFAIDKTMTISGGFGAVLAVEDIVVALNGPVFNNSYTYFRLNDAKDEILNYKKGSNINKDASANSVNGVRYGSKLIFSLIRTGVTGATDSNKAVVDIFDVLNKGIEWDASSAKENSVLENVYAYFKEDYLAQDKNTLYVSGKTSAKSARVIFALTDKNGNIVKTEASEAQTVKDGELKLTASINLKDEDIDGCLLTAYLWEGSDSLRPIASALSPNNAAFSFTLSERARTSAGVYDKEGRLVRTLWSAVYYDAGEHTECWDGKDDQGVAMPDGEYKITVMSNNVEFEKFVDVIGNTSDCYSWDTFISSYCSIFDMGYDPRTNRIYYCSNHVEGGYGLRYLNADNIHKNAALMDGFYANMTAVRVAADSERIYWGSEEIEMGDYEGKGYKYSRAFVYATDDAAKPYTFEYGEHVTSKWNDANNCVIYPSALNINITSNEENNRISGIEVQQDGNLLFSAYLDMGSVFVNDKNTGELLYTLSANKVAGIAIGGENEDILYVAQMAEDGTYEIVAYDISESGELTKRRVALSGISSVIALAVSPNGEKAAVVLGGDVNKLEIFSIETGNMLMSFGSGESYTNDATVKDDKLTFLDNVWGYQERYEHSFIEFLGDSELLFGDSGNTRFYKMDLSSKELKIADQNIFLGCNYSTNAVLNDESRIYAELLEYSVDYDKLEEYANDKSIPFETTWKIEKNYRRYFDEHFPQISQGAIEGTFSDAVLLSNGYTYFRMKETDGNYYLYKEKDGQIERTDIELTRCDILEDGSLYYKEFESGATLYYRKTLSGFDENQNPIWNEEELIATVKDEAHNPYNADRGLYQVAITDTDKFIVLEAAGPDFSAIDAETGVNMHLGAIDISRSSSADEYLWTAMPRTLRRYVGDFPDDGYFDIGKNVQYTVRHPLALGENILVHYRGEGYRSKQSNKFFHYLDNGLLVGVYGRNLTERGGGYNAYGGDIIETQPCNSFSVSLVACLNNSDVAYIFQNSEGAAGGVHVSRLSGLDTIKTQDMSVNLRSGMSRGIKYSIYDNKDLNSAGFIKSGISNNFNLEEMKGGEKSVRFECYFLPSESKTYRFGVQTDGYARLYIENALISQGNGSIAGNVTLSADRKYKLVLEVMPQDGVLSYLNVGYEIGRAYHYISDSETECLFPSADKSNQINLLEGFKYGEAFVENRYGWHTELIGGNSSAYITVTTNAWNYRHDADTDLLLKFAVPKVASDKNEAYLEKSLGTVNSASWQVDMDIRMYGYMNRTYRKNVCGMIIEILDDNDKVIADFYIGGGAEADEDWRGFINGEMVASEPKILYTSTYGNVEQISEMMETAFNIPQSLSFSANENGTITGEYMGNSITAEIVDEEADFMRPAKVRFKRFNNFSGAPYGSTLNITRFNLTKDKTK